MRAIKQRDWSDCGVACLAALASHYAMRLSVAQIRQLTGTDQSGTTVFGLVQASKQLGFIAKAVKAQVDRVVWYRLSSNRPCDRPGDALPLYRCAKITKKRVTRDGSGDGAFFAVFDSPSSKRCGPES